MVHTSFDPQHPAAGITSLASGGATGTAATAGTGATVASPLVGSGMPSKTYGPVEWEVVGWEWLVWLDFHFFVELSLWLLGRGC